MKKLYIIAYQDAFGCVDVTFRWANNQLKAQEFFATKRDKKIEQIREVKEAINKTELTDRLNRYINKPLNK